MRSGLTVGLLLAGLSHASAAEKPVPLVRAHAAPAKEDLLDVHVSVFDPAEDFLPEVRRAEARYVPVHLKRALQSTGYFGVVRAVPQREPAELNLTGAVIASHGQALKLEVRVVDATGNVWLDDDYKKKADASAYLGADSTEEPFQNLYHRIANDVVKKYEKLDQKEIARIRDVARLRFASELAPSIFQDYLLVRNERFDVARLPARDDPMMERVERIRQRNATFIDTLDAYYEKLYAKMQEPYGGWRSRDYWQREAMKNGPPTATRSGGRNAPLGVLTPGEGRRRPWDGGRSPCDRLPVCGDASSGDERDSNADPRAKSHLDILRELGASLAVDVAPVLLEVEGRVVSLMGSVDAQYAEWRKLLREIFVAETS